MAAQALVFQCAKSGASLHVSDTPLRKSVRRGSVNKNGWFRSALTGGLIQCESMGEYDFAQCSEADVRVTDIRAQHVRLDLACGAHFPDFFVQFDGRPELHEIKSDKYIDHDEVQEKALASARLMAAVGGVYSLNPYSSIRREPVWSNVQFVLRRLHDRVNQVTCDAMFDVLQDTGGCSLGELAGRTNDVGGSPEAALWLIARGGALIDYFDRPVTFKNFRDAWVAPLDAREPQRILPFNPVDPDND